ncbi:acyltransferase [Duffyella gerundensis]|uniref:acyltransferase family protein n=1 Tax=Duffyella gerundensis TaxID=1619313 RepID=UPI001AE201CD|nr:acyltransferase [Duffyella gerundensis]QTO55378.1 acyltransferase [Duffyella gerundensis]
MLSLYLLFVFVVSFFSCSILAYKIIGLDYGRNRNDKVDGLRGLLAFMVALFHYGATYNIELYGIWSSYDSLILKNFGSFSVSVFFIISGFVFYSTIFSKECKWLSFYISRILRIYPLFLMVLIFIVLVSYFKGNSSDLSGLYKYFLFGWGDLFGYDQSYLVNSGVQWTLLYEWLFYAALPLLWALKNKKFTAWFAISALASYVAFDLASKGQIDFKLFLLFISGLACRHLSKEKFNKISNLKFITISLICVTTSLFFSYQYSYIQMMSVSVLFYCFLISGFRIKPSINKFILSMSEASYGIYMIHGVVFFIIFRAGLFETKMISPWLFFSLFPVVMFFVTFLASYSFIYIERSSMSAARKISCKLR